DLLVLPSFPTRRSSDLLFRPGCIASCHTRPAADAVPAMAMVPLEAMGDADALDGFEPIDPEAAGLDLDLDEPRVSYSAQYHDMIDRKSTRLNSSHVKIS